MFETFGDDFEFVQKQPPHKIWTEMDFGDGKIHILNGMHFVNRVAYYVTKKAWHASHIDVIRDL